MLLQFMLSEGTTFKHVSFSVVASSLGGAQTSIVASCLAPPSSDISISDSLCAGPQAAYQAARGLGRRRSQQLRSFAPTAVEHLFKMIGGFSHSRICCSKMKLSHSSLLGSISLPVHPTSNRLHALPVLCSNSASSGKPVRRKVKTGKATATVASIPSASAGATVAAAAVTAVSVADDASSSAPAAAAPPASDITLKNPPLGLSNNIVPARKYTHGSFHMLSCCQPRVSTFCCRKSISTSHVASLWHTGLMSEQDFSTPLMF
jgi:hypothetical protein